MIIDSIIVLALLAAPQASASRSSAAGGGQRVKFVATATYTDGTARVIEGNLDIDSDKDGVNDTVVLRVTCARGAVATAIVSPRDSASGLPTGKRVRKPVAITKDSGNTTASDDWTRRLQGKPVLASWDIATGKASREAAAPALSERVLAPSDVSPIVCSAS